MGLKDFFRRRAGNTRAQEAARQMYVQLAAGKSFEVPASLSLDDLVTQAVLVLREDYPDVEVQMLQSRGIVLSRKKSSAVTKEGWDVLSAGGYFPDRKLRPEDLLAVHEAFMERNGLTREDASRNAQKEHEARTSIGEAHALTTPEVEIAAAPEPVSPAPVTAPGTPAGS